MSEQLVSLAAVIGVGYDVMTAAPELAPFVALILVLLIFHTPRTMQ